MATERGIVLPHKIHNSIVAEALKIRFGLRPKDAKACAKFCAQALELGIRTHSTTKLFSLLEYVLRNLDPNGKWKVERRFPSIQLWNGNGQIGIPVAQAATKRAIKMAKKFGTGTVMVRNFTHCLSGVLYLNQIANAVGKRGERFMGMYYSTAGFGDEVVPYGGRRGSMGTNPIGFVIPLGDGQASFLFDAATSERSMGYIAYARTCGLQLEPGVALDENGTPTLDPALAETLCAFGGHKGSSIASFLEVLSGLSGAGIPAQRNDQAGELSNFGIFVANLDALKVPGVLDSDSQIEQARLVCESIYRDNGTARVPGENKHSFSSTASQLDGLFIPNAMIPEFKKIAAISDSPVAFDSYKEVEV